MRDEFSQETKHVLAQRVGCRCSNPDCRVLTSGPQIEPTKALNIGVAAHITAAASGGPRFDPRLSEEQRRNPENGIWLCQNCAKLVDNDERAYPAELLRNWKRQAEAKAILEMGRAAQVLPRQDMAAEELELLLHAADEGDLWVISTQQVGSWVRSGRRDFMDPADPAYAAQYLDALKSLQDKCLVRFNRGIGYSLSGTGFRVARKLRRILEGDGT